MFDSKHRQRSLRLLALVVATLASSAAGSSPGYAQALGSRLHISAVSVGWNFAGGNRDPYAFVFIADEFGNPVDGAVVVGNWSGCNVVKGASGVTRTFFNDDGSVRFHGAALIAGHKHACLNNNCLFAFTVTNVSLPGTAYDPTANVTSSGACACNPLAP
jgi:hypothetical protein